MRTLFHPLRRSLHRLAAATSVAVTIAAVLMPSSMAASYHTPLPADLDGSMTPYNLSVNQPLSAVVPDSLAPIFVNYIGRHGARYLSSAKKVDNLRNTLEEARTKGFLTDRGKEFLTLLDRVETLSAGQWGALDSIGIEEQRELAHQMHSMFPGLLSAGRVDAIATYVPRVVMSMYQFCHTLAKEAPDLEIYTSEGKQNNPTLRFFNTDKDYAGYLEHGPWHPVLDAFISSRVPVLPAIRLVSEHYALDTSRLRKMSLEIYGVLQSLRATGMGAPTEEWMSEDEYRACWEADNLDHFLRRTFNGISYLPGRAAGPLLMSFVEYGDSAATGRSQLRAMLRFAHAETLMPLFSLMRIPGCYSMSTDYDNIYRFWKDCDVVPLGANLLVAYLRGHSGKVYVAMRLNGRWVAPMADGRMVVGWNELRSSWLENLRWLSSTNPK